MIGIIGPRDSVSLAQRTADEFHRSDELLAVAYDDIAGAVPLARSIETSCDAILFTGLVPFERAKRDGAWRCDLSMIAHSEADLYRMISIVLKDTGGQFPRVSIDGLPHNVVHSVFRDLGLPSPVITPLVNDFGDLAFDDVTELAQAHSQAIARGDAEAALTCLGGAHQALLEKGERVWRVDHAHVTIAEALRRAWLALEVDKARGSGIAVVLLEPVPRKGRSHAGVLPHEIAGLRDALDVRARRLGSRVTVEGSRFILTTTRAGIDEARRRFVTGRQSLFDLTRRQDARMSIGVGLGATFSIAHAAAERAIHVSADENAPAIVSEDGEVDVVTKGGPNVRVFETSASAIRLAERTGLGPPTLRRIISALGRVGGTTVTADQFGSYYGVKPRSARRILGVLAEAGLAQEVGVRAGPGAGRPHVVYDVDLLTLTRLMSGDPAAGESPASTFSNAALG